MLADISLETKRLFLREFVSEDWVFVHSYASDLEVVRYMLWGPNREEDTRKFIKDMIACQTAIPRNVFDLAVHSKTDGCLIGSCGIRVGKTISEGASLSATVGSKQDYSLAPYAYTRELHASLGYCFRKDSWSQGFATEASGAVVRFGFEQLGLHKIFATCDVENKGSARVLEKIGMRREGHLVEDIKIKGRWRDSYLYALTFNEWKAVNL